MGGMNSNGHVEGKDDNMNMAETIKNCRRMSRVTKMIMKGL
jgi:hypothetical protein